MRAPTRPITAFINLEQSHLPYTLVGPSCCTQDQHRAGQCTHLLNQIVAHHIQSSGTSCMQYRTYSRNQWFCNQLLENLILISNRTLIWRVYVMNPCLLVQFPCFPVKVVKCWYTVSHFFTVCINIPQLIARTGGPCFTITWADG